MLILDISGDAFSQSRCVTSVDERHIAYDPKPSAPPTADFLIELWVGVIELQTVKSIHGQTGKKVLPHEIPTTTTCGSRRFRVGARKTIR